MITHNYFKAAHIKKDGKSKLYLRITIDREHNYYELMNIVSKLWLKSKGRIKPIDEDALLMNSYLNQVAKDVDRAILGVKSNNLKENFGNFETFYFKKSIDLVSFFETTISNMHEPEYHKDTIRIYQNCLNKIKLFIKGESIELSDIDYNFISRFESYMIDMGLMRNTIATQLKKLNKVLNDAKKQKIIDRNPFETFQIKQEKTHRVFLMKDELQKLHELFDKDTLNSVLNNTLHAFLFSCYTGLRHSDVVKIKYNDINENNTIDITLKKKTSNGYKRLVVPLSKKAINLIDITPNSNSLIFPKLISATKCSIHLKAIAGVCGIDWIYRRYCASVNSYNFLAKFTH